MEGFSRSIENYVGTLKVPVGIAGPSRVNGLFAQGDYYIPLETMEGALVASFDRGARLLSEAGGGSIETPPAEFSSLQEVSRNRGDRVRNRQGVPINRGCVSINFQQ